MLNTLSNNRINSTKYTLGKRSILTTVQCAVDKIMAHSMENK